MVECIVPRMRLLWLWMMPMVATGCEPSHAAVDDPDREEPQVGEPCSGKNVSTCRPDGTVVVCTDGYWGVKDCESECGAETPWAGCLVTPLGGGCYCEGAAFDPFAYHEPFTRCLDAQSALSCDDGVCTEHACSDVCEDAGGLLSLGCIHLPTEDSCYCTLEGAPCDEVSTAPRCDSDDAIAACVDGYWVLESCDVGCEEAERGTCRLQADELPSCECVPEGP